MPIRRTEEGVLVYSSGLMNHNGDYHRGNALRDSVEGVAGLDANGHVLGKGWALKLARSATDLLMVYDRTSNEFAGYWKRVGVNDWELWVQNGGVDKRTLHVGDRAGMKITLPTPTLTGWNTNPAPLSEITDDDYANLTTFGDASGGLSTIIYDLGTTYHLSLALYHSTNGANMQVYGSLDNITYMEVAQAMTKNTLATCGMVARYIKLTANGVGVTNISLSAVGARLI